MAAKASSPRLRASAGAGEVVVGDAFRAPGIAAEQGDRGAGIEVPDAEAHVIERARHGRRLRAHGAALGRSERRVARFKQPCMRPVVGFTTTFGLADLTYRFVERPGIE